MLNAHGDDHGFNDDRGAAFHDVARDAAHVLDASYDDACDALCDGACARHLQHRPWILIVQK